MKTWIWIFFAFGCSAGIVQSKVVCAAPVFDFGGRDEGEKVVHVFKLRNTGTDSVRITRVKTSCGCTAATLEKRVIPPGVEIDLDVRLDLTRRSGRQSKSVYVFTDNPKSKQIVLRLEGTVSIHVELNPRVFMFGQLGPEDDGRETRSVVIHGLNKPLQPGKPSCSDPSVQCRLLSGSTDNVYVVEAGLPDELPPGRFSATVFVPVYGGRQVLKIPVFAMVPGPVIVVPSNIQIPKNKDGKLFSRLIQIRPGIIKSFKVLSVKCDGLDIKADVRSMEQGGYTIVLKELDPKLVKGRSVSIKTSASGAELLTVPFR